MTSVDTSLVNPTSLVVPGSKTNEKYNNAMNHIRDNLSHMRKIYPDKKEYKNIERVFNKVRNDLEPELYQLAGLSVEYFMETGRSPEDHIGLRPEDTLERFLYDARVAGIKAPVYDAKIPDITDVIKDIIKNVDEGNFNAIRLSLISKSAINGYLEQMMNPPAPPPEAPEVPPLKIETEKGTVSIPPLK